MYKGRKLSSTRERNEQIYKPKQGTRETTLHCSPYRKANLPGAKGINTTCPALRHAALHGGRGETRRHQARRKRVPPSALQCTPRRGARQERQGGLFIGWPPRGVCVRVRVWAWEFFSAVFRARPVCRWGEGRPGGDSDRGARTEGKGQRGGGGEGVHGLRRGGEGRETGASQCIVYYCLCAARLAPLCTVHCAVCVFCPGYDSYCDCRRGHPRYGGAARCGVECIISCTRWTGGRAVPALGCTEGAAGRSGGARYVPPACRTTPIVCLGGEVHCAVAKKW